MATKSKPVEIPEPAPAKCPAPRRAGPVRYSVSKADLRERGLYEERQGIPLPNVADLMSFILKGMVLFLIFNLVRGVWSMSESPSQNTSVANSAAVRPVGSSKGVRQHIDTVTETADAATDWFADLLRDAFNKQPYEDGY